MNEYLKQLNTPNELNHEFFENLREYAKENNVPIIEEDSLFLIQSILNMM